MKGYIKPYSDVFIQYLLGSEHNSNLLLSFINAVLLDSNFYQISRANEELREIYESRMKWERDQTSRIQDAKAEGRKEGRKEGLEEGMEKVALNMLKSGLPVEQIANLTELTQEEVQALSQKIAN